ncbi:MAG: NTP transferase domain-containing protein [Pseudodesulfovibrio sp.]|uniref:Metal dependent phosphohydrolase n=1 Tax=Pseudodesulfovibrio aespoeensis (strain ATCC 700646 / DSM 10631 / Aspo-2) TaxID=643562 RepID=E6VS73_PSEA9|nr:MULTISPECIES: NTP transferase domain-containing protein [Pseudodesulfovibrio]MBU4192915.1 NTP transferase domain-containing protein [Pseudomonadota bacterium]ADU63118.1 metal dependent phosphohydrolase [Pseudodesulfovibrio aespoeensis Aspo-2]MBU4244318.1 NTP transferase domain-containing protein [Pseudomonadota bacterium]MBU4379039.1 NTP transferase domain-containing protein [Pseudomonadota bacterium]MBU4475079.1 NTP transferase domain-containing protein [Pseudomonadota bacterium]
MSGLAAIIPAAGLSSRMGRCKPLLPLGGGTVLSRCIALFQENRIDPILVVTGKNRDAVSSEAVRAGVIPIHNNHFEQGMFSSVLTGIGALPPDVSAFFLLPVDMPLVRPETISRLVDEYRRTAPALLYPRFLGERGHPPVIGRELLPDILHHDGFGGLRTVLQRHEADALDLDVADSGTLLDLDHPEDYEHALARFDTAYPNERECRQLWAMRDLPEHIADHCRAVARVAAALCARLNTRSGVAALNPALVRGAALTHDIGKGTKRHETVGANLLRTHGFHAAADIVAEHFDLTLPLDQPITEKEVVFLADKLVRCQSPVALDARYLEKLAAHRHEPGAGQAILGRLERARSLLSRFDREMGIPAELLAREALA